MLLRTLCFVESSYFRYKLARSSHVAIRLDLIAGRWAYRDFVANAPCRAWCLTTSTAVAMPTTIYAAK